VNPPTSGGDEGHSEGQSFGDMDVGDDFWGELDQIEDAERGSGSGRPSAATSTQGSRTLVSNFGSAAIREVIELDDDEESDEPDDWIFGNSWNKENVSDSKVRRVTPPPVPSSQPRPKPTQVQEVIELSD
jgi:hypothetical protein